ncbi:hypothetical protein B0H12DRAFT_1107391, partial [Mycena haematopus]
LASQNFLCQWDPTLASAVDQLAHTVLLKAALLSSIAATVNFAELQRQATKVMEKTCTGAHLFAIGGYNVVYLLLFDDGTDILARLRIPAGDLGDNGRDMTAEHLSARFTSEVRRSWSGAMRSDRRQVATLLWLRARVPSIPVPQLYAWDGDDTNPVGAPYMLMQRVGVVVRVAP